MRSRRLPDLAVVPISVVTCLLSHLFYSTEHELRVSGTKDSLLGFNSFSLEGCLNFHSEI